MPTRPSPPAKSNSVPFELGGKWLAWNAAHTEIVDSSESLPELWNRVRESGVCDPIFEKAPRQFGQGIASM